MNKVVEVEVLLNIVNTLLSKARFLKRDKEFNNLKSIRHDIYYQDNLDYKLTMHSLKEIDGKLNNFINA